MAGERDQGAQRPSGALRREEGLLTTGNGWRQPGWRATVAATGVSVGGGEQWFEQRGACRIGDAPGDDPAAEDIAADTAIKGAPCFKLNFDVRVVPITRSQIIRLLPSHQLSEFLFCSLDPTMADIGSGRKISPQLVA